MKKFSTFKVFFFALLLITFCSRIQAQETDKPVRYLNHDLHEILRTNTDCDDIFDIKYHRMEVEVDPDIRYIEGMVCTYFEPVNSEFDTLNFDFRDNMTVDSIKHNDTLLLYSFSSSTNLEVLFGEILTQGVLDSIKIFYKGIPIDDGFGSFRISQSDCSGDHPIMWTLSEPYGSKNWWPCKETLDDKADSLDMIVTTGSEYTVGSNGLLLNETVNGNQKTFHWRHRYPIPAYLVAFAVAEYAIYSDFVDIPGTSEQIEVLNYVFPCNLTYAQNQTPLLDTIFKFFIEKFGAYPYENEKYGHAECGFGGGMEHSTMSFMGSFGVSLMAHELAHQWFGDKITCGTWHDIWLNEGFATYLDGLTCERGIGYTSWYNWKNDKINYVTQSNFGSTYVSNISSVYSIFNYRLVYSKGSLLLHMLRWKLGDTDFFNAIMDYISDPDLAYSYAVTDDLKAHLEEESGQDLTEFFDDWLYGEGWPDYDIGWEYDSECDKVYVEIQQTHSANDGTFFEMPVPIRFSDESQDTIVIFDQDSPDRTDFYASLDFIPTQITFDPDKWLCAKHSIVNTTLPPRTIRWTGAINNLWTDANNWDCNVPTSNDHVIIPDGTPQCLINPGDPAHCRSLKIESNATLILRETAEIIIEEQ